MADKKSEETFLKEDDVLRRMLNTPPKPHKPKKDEKAAEPKKARRPVGD